MFQGQRTRAFLVRCRDDCVQGTSGPRCRRTRPGASSWTAEADQDQGRASRRAWLARHGSDPYRGLWLVPKLSSRKGAPPGAGSARGGAQRPVASQQRLTVLICQRMITSSGLQGAVCAEWRPQDSGTVFGDGTRSFLGAQKGTNVERQTAHSVAFPQAQLLIPKTTVQSIVNLNSQNETAKSHAKSYHVRSEVKSAVDCAAASRGPCRIPDRGVLSPRGRDGVHRRRQQGLERCQLPRRLLRLSHLHERQASVISRSAASNLRLS